MRRLLLTIVGFPLFLAACTGAGSGPYGGGAAVTPSPRTAASGPSAAPVATPAPVAATPAPTPPGPTPVAVSLLARGSTLGTVLADPRGRTLYYFVPERGGRIVCSGACTTYWPPSYSATGNPAAGAGVIGRLTVIMRGGGDQLVYNNWPLYTFAGDSAAGQTNGQGVVGFGGKWLVATPSLRP